MWRWVFLFCGWCTLNAPTTLANAPALTGSAIKHLVSGTVMYINTPLNTKIPVRYGADGQLAGAAGSMSFYLGASKDTGRWWVARNRLCHKWSRWFDGDTQCLKLRRSGSKIFWASDTGRTGTAYITRSKSPKPKAVAATPAPKRMMTAAAAVSPVQTSKPVAQKSPALKKNDAPNTVRYKKKDGVARAQPANPKPVAQKRKSLKMRQGVEQRQPNAVRAAKRPATKTSPPRAALRQTAGTRASSTRANSLTQTAGLGAPSFRVARVSDFDVLNIRKGPSEYHEIVGRIPPTGRGVKIVGACQSWWCPVQHRNARGWVNRFYLSQER